MISDTFHLRCAALLLICAAGGLLAQGQPDYELPPISYSKTTPQDAIQGVQHRISSGELALSGTSTEILKALLNELGVPVESQLLVFSRTSLQRNRIGPDRPRALYFSDDCYVGWVPGGILEITTMDPLLGPVFYSFDPEIADFQKQRFVRDNDCLRCHGGSMVRNTPGLLARSVYADETGEPLLRHGTELVDYRTPFKSRWGGWYVTGKHGSAIHRGNTLSHEEKGDLVANFASGANITNLSRFFDVENYLAPTSDIVALMIFEHQIAMHNALARASFHCRRMLEYQRNLQKELKEPETDELSYDSVKSVFESAAREVVDHLLFRDEAPLPAPLEGSKAFQEAFLKNARRSGNGDSLKDLRLETVLFKNRCSYLIYSEIFMGLPEPLKRLIYDRLAMALHPTEPDSRYGYIAMEERARIFNLLRETHPELRKRWRDMTPAGNPPGLP